MARTEERRERKEREARELEERVSLLESEPEVKTSETPKLHPIRRLKELWHYREILVNLTRKEVKVKYTSSILGSAWSMLNPIMYLVVFSFVFQVVLKSGIPDFPIYLLSGLLAWNLFSGSLTLSARSVVENANLVKKVYFPREILPLASVGATVFDFLLQGVVLLAFMLIAQYTQAIGLNLLLLPLSMLALLLFSTALSLLVGALNVRYRDTQHLLNLALLTWFWLTPIVYQFGLVQDRLTNSRFGEAGLVAYLIINPMATVVAGFQRALYAVVAPHSPAFDPAKNGTVLLDVSIGELALLLGVVCLISIGFILVFWRFFFRQAGDFAEEL